MRREIDKNIFLDYDSPGMVEKHAHLSGVLDEKDPNPFEELDSYDYFYAIIDECFDRKSPEYECFARFHGIDGRES